MTRITRYVLFELIKVFTVVLTGITVFMLVFGVAQEALRQGLGPEPIVRLIPYVLPNALRFAVPATILFAACSVYGRLSAENEITALKSVGASPMVVVWPALIFAFFVSLSAVWLNDIAASWGRKGIHRVVLQSVEQIAYGMLRTQKSYSTNRLAISVVDVEGKTLIHPTLTIHASESSPAITMTAERARLRLNASRDALTLVLEDSEVDWGEQLSGVIPGMIEHEIPLSFASRKGELGIGPSDCPLRRIDEHVREQRERLEGLQQRLAAEAAYQMLSGDFDRLRDPAWLQRHEELKHARYLLFRYQTEPWRRWANGFSCLFFVMVGAPLAIRLRNSDFWTSFMLCFLPILVVYYPLLDYGVGKAKTGAGPPYMVWFGNIVLMLIGIWLMRSVRRY